MLAINWQQKSSQMGHTKKDNKETLGLNIVVTIKEGNIMDNSTQPGIVSGTVCNHGLYYPITIKTC